MDVEVPVEFGSHLDLEYGFGLRIWTGLTLMEVCALQLLGGGLV